MKLIWIIHVCVCVYIYIYLYVYLFSFYLSKHAVCLLTALCEIEVVLTTQSTQVILKNFLFINTWHFMFHLVIVIRDANVQGGFSDMILQDSFIMLN